MTSAPDTSVSVRPVEDLGEAVDVDAHGRAARAAPGRGDAGGQAGPDAGSGSPSRPPIVQAGRHPESDIFLDDITVSRRHAEFVTRDQMTTVRDVGSLNGTYLNRERIEEARLSSGDEVQIGKFKLLYLLASGE